MSAAAEQRPLRSAHVRPSGSPGDQRSRSHRENWLPPCSRVSKVSEITCLSCPAAQQGLSCWQVATSPCCKRSRDQCSTCRIYAQIHKAVTVAHPVRMCLRDGRWLQGRIHVAGTERLSDRINGSEGFLTMTEVAWDSQEDLGRQNPDADCDAAAVLFVAKSHVALIQPLDAEADGEEPGASNAAPRPT